MLSYKYYQNPENRTIHIPTQLITINNIFKDEFKKTYTDTMNELANPIYVQHNRYGIWDILAENAPEILSNTMIQQYDKLYLAKLLISFRDSNVIPAGVEYYCLRHIIRLAAFRIRANLKWVATSIITRMKQLQSTNKNKKQSAIFTRNVRKIEIVKRVYNTRVILRAHWRNVYDCYNLGSNTSQELLNQIDILKYLNILPENAGTQGTTNNIDVDKEFENIDKILDEELEIDTDIDSIIGLSGLSELIETNTNILEQPDEPIIDDLTGMMGRGKIDYQLQPLLNDADTISQPGPEIDDAVIEEVDEMAVEPDEW